VISLAVEIKLLHVPDVIVPTPDNNDSVVTAELTNVPVVGNVTLVAAVDVNVIENAPLVAKVEPDASVNVVVATGVGVDIDTPFTVLVINPPICNLS
jgi:hypothetical protein